MNADCATFFFVNIYCDDDFGLLLVSLHIYMCVCTDFPLSHTQALLFPFWLCCLFHLSGVNKNWTKHMAYYWSFTYACTTIHSYIKKNTNKTHALYFPHTRINSHIRTLTHTSLCNVKQATHQLSLLHINTQLKKEKERKKKQISVHCIGACIHTKQPDQLSL